LERGERTAGSSVTLWHAHSGPKPASAGSRGTCAADRISRRTRSLRTIRSPKRTTGLLGAFHSLQMSRNRERLRKALLFTGRVLLVIRRCMHNIGVRTKIFGLHSSRSFIMQEFLNFSTKASFPLVTYEHRGTLGGLGSSLIVGVAHL
jgi:hypothetical protein